MKDRIMKILQHENLSSSKFADLIGVQRSSVSHILSGRNNPGLDFLSKILGQFTSISGDWLITGQGSMLKKNNIQTISPSLFDSPSGIEKVSASNKERFNESKTPNNPIQSDNIIGSVPRPSTTSTIEHQNSDNSLKMEHKTVERIMVFYHDKTFREYLPE